MCPDGLKTFEAWVSYLQDVPWTQFATFTTSKPLSLRGARRLMVNVASHVLREDEKMFWAVEPFSLGVREGSYHVHALLETRQSPKQIEDWYLKKYGRAEVRRYDRSRGAAVYVSKYMMKSLCDYDLFLGNSKK